MLQVFAGEDIMDNMPPVVQTAAVVGGDNPSTASGCALNGRTFMTASFRMQEKTSCYAFTQSMPVSDAVRAVSQEQ